MWCNICVKTQCGAVKWLGSIPCKSCKIWKCSSCFLENPVGHVDSKNRISPIWFSPTKTKVYMSVSFIFMLFLEINSAKNPPQNKSCCIKSHWSSTSLKMSMKTTLALNTHLFPNFELSSCFCFCLFKFK